MRQKSRTKTEKNKNERREPQAEPETVTVETKTKNNNHETRAPKFRWLARRQRRLGCNDCSRQLSGRILQMADERNGTVRDKSTRTKQFPNTQQ